MNACGCSALTSLFASGVWLLCGDLTLLLGLVFRLPNNKTYVASCCMGRVTTTMCYACVHTDFYVVILFVALVAGLLRGSNISVFSGSIWLTTRLLWRWQGGVLYVGTSSILSLQCVTFQNRVVVSGPHRGKRSPCDDEDQK